MIPQSHQTSVSCFTKASNVNSKILRSRLSGNGKAPNSVNNIVKRKPSKPSKLTDKIDSGMYNLLNVIWEYWALNMT